MSPSPQAHERAAGAGLLPRRVALTAAPEELLRQAGASRSGLDDAEAQARLRRYGPNRIARGRGVSLWRLVADQIMDPLIYVLLAAAAVTLALQHYTDTAVILVVVLFNGIIGFTQEYRANQAIEALSSLTRPSARVRRAGRVRTISSEELVPGDLLLVRAGSGVDADARVISAHELVADESLLTGESAPVEKTAAPLADPEVTVGDQHNMLFSGSLVLQGRGEALVLRTGPNSELGQIAEMVTGIERVETPLQHQVGRFTRLIAAATVGLAAVTMALGVLRGTPVGEMFLVAVALAVSAIPEGLPVVVTITLAIGVSRMARRKAVIRKLPAVETLGSTQVICSDKTGTLTLNHMMVQTTLWGPWRLEAGAYETSAGETEPVAMKPTAEDSEAACEGGLCEVLRAALFASNAERIIDEHGEQHYDGDPTEIALAEMVAVRQPHLFEERQARPAAAQVPFTSERKFMATVHPGLGGEGWTLFAKGSPEAIIQRCALEWAPEGEQPLDAQHWLDAAGALAEEGRRVIGLAYREWPDDAVSEHEVRDLVLLGLVGIMDPPRPEAAAAVRGCQQAGIRVIMVTGDHAATARAVAVAVGIIPRGDAPVDRDPRVVTGRQLDGMTDPELAERLDQVAVYARVTPAHKLRIVRQFSARGQVVAVTGDGVNDAPALRQAHLGAAMGKAGTEVAKQASDMVLLDDSFATIYEAVREGRYVFENIRKVSFFLISSGVAEIVAILAAIALAWPLPYVAVQILWINLVTNGLQDVALAFEPGEERVLREPPRGLRAGVINRLVAQHMAVVAVVFSAGTLFTFSEARASGMDLAYARTVAMTTMVMLQMSHAFSCRSLVTSAFVIPLRRNLFLFVSLMLAMAAQAAVIYWAPLQTVFGTVALRGASAVNILLVSACGVAAMEVSKWYARRRAA